MRVGFAHKAVDCVWVCGAWVVLLLPTQRHTLQLSHSGLYVAGRLGCKEMPIAYQSYLQICSELMGLLTLMHRDKLCFESEVMHVGW